MHLTSKNNEVFFQYIKEFLQKKEYVKVKELLSENADNIELIGNEAKEYHYYLGMVALFGEGNIQEAVYQFNLSLQEDSNNKFGMIEVFTINCIGMVYLI